MATWHAYADGPLLATGTGVLVTDGTQSVRIRVGDMISVETPECHLFSLIVVDQTRNRLTAFFDGGALLRLQLGGSPELFERFRPAEGSSRQGWVIQ
jgi:hypothetical protein